MQRLSSEKSQIGSRFQLDPDPHRSPKETEYIRVKERSDAKFLQIFLYTHVDDLLLDLRPRRISTNLTNEKKALFTLTNRSRPE